jgi:hypothetical protein
MQWLNPSFKFPVRYACMMVYPPRIREMALANSTRGSTYGQFVLGILEEDAEAALAFLRLACTINYLEQPSSVFVLFFCLCLSTPIRVLEFLVSSCPKHTNKEQVIHNREEKQPDCRRHLPFRRLSILATPLRKQRSRDWCRGWPTSVTAIKKFRGGGCTLPRPSSKRTYEPSSRIRLFSQHA